MHSLKFRKDKRLIIKGEPYPENYNFSFKLFKIYSQFFSNNIEYKYMDDIVFHYPSQISTSSFIQFIKSCQNEEFTIDQDNIFDLLVLSEIFQVEILKKQIDLHIKNNGPPMIIQSLQYKFNLIETNQQQDLCSNINSVSEEKAIGEMLIQFLQNEQDRDYLISLPMNMLYNILRTYSEFHNHEDDNNENNNSNDNENQNNDNKDILIDFLVDVLQKHGRTASIIFSIFDFGERKLDVIKKISKKDIDYKCINDLLISVFDDVLKENEQIKDETTNQLNELGNQISVLKNQIDIHFGISSIVQENIIRNNGDDYLETVDFENDESARQLGKHYYQEILSTLLMPFDEKSFQNCNSKLKKKIILEYCRLALNNLLNDDQIIELLKYMNKRQKDELIFLLAYKGQLPVSIINLKREIKHARIPSNITDVDDSLFDDFPSIESVSLHKNVQSLSNIKTKLPQLKEIIITYSSQEKTLDLLNSVYEINGPTKSNDNFKVKSIIKYENGIKKISKIFDNRIEFKKLIKQFILPPSTLLIEPGSFVSCNLEEMKIPPRIITIPDRCFSDCSMLKKVIIPNSVKIIEEKAFYLCKSLTEIILPNSIEVIKDSTFEYSGLKKIKLPPLLKTVQKYTFSNCIALEEVEFNVNLELIEADAFLDCTALLNVNLSKCTKVVYEKSSFPSNCEIIEPQNDS